jgi:transposase
MYTVTCITRDTNKYVTHGEYASKRDAYNVARNLSKDAAISIASVKTGKGYELRNLGTWFAGKRVV